MKLGEDLYNYAISHLVDKGDTDIFPYPFELKFFAECSGNIANTLSNLDLQNYRPMSLVESLIPKTKFGFRVAHQAYPIDALIFMTLIISIFDKIESGRDEINNNRAFSYRKSNGLSENFFVPDRTYRGWLNVLLSKVFSEEYNYVIRTDISDFYSRIYRHRLENIMTSLSGEKRIVKKIEQILADWRGNQSFGIPVGSNSSRLLAEAALNDTDMALISEGYDFTRYVDDFVIFIKRDQDAYAALAFLAKHLSANEGLSLNNQKTKILEWNDFISSIDQPSAEDDPSNEDSATEKLFWSAYGQDDADPAAIEALMTKDLQKELEDLLAESFWDMGSIRIVLHAMRLVQNADVASYIRNNLATLIPFSKDICLLIEEFSNAGVPGFENMSAEITDLLLSTRMQPLDSARSWFLELGVRKIVNFSQAEIRRLDALTGTLDLRQMHLIRWRANDLNFFRSRKARVSEITAWAQPSFIFGARCLPLDEYSHWIRSIKSRLQFPLAKEFAEWCLDSHGRDPL